MIIPSGPLKSHRAALLATGVLATLAACHHVSVDPTPPPGAPAPAAASSAIAATPRDSAPRVRRGYTAADVRFMHHMLMHHAQAVAMTAMVPSRSARDDVRLVAERIAISQRDESALMERWLRARGEHVPAAMDHGHHAGGAHGGAAHGGAAHGGGAHGGMAMRDSAHAAMMASMPGMPTPAELRQLEASSGTAFDTLFVRLMIRHHEGALTMVKEYLATPGAAQEPEVFRFASDVDADQRAEIRRLRTLLGD